MPWSRCGLAALVLIAGFAAGTELSLTADAQQPSPPAPKPVLPAVRPQAPATPARFVAWKTAQAAWITRSLALAGVLNSALLHAGTTVTLGRTPLPGIESMTCPAVAIEVAPERDSDHKVTAEPDDANY